MPPSKIVGILKHLVKSGDPGTGAIEIYSV